jgi:hypothetical protein
MSTLYGDQYAFLIISRSVLQRMKNISDKIYTENRNTHVKFVFRKSCLSRDNGKKYCIFGQATVDSMAHAHCMLDA